MEIDMCSTRAHNQLYREGGEEDGERENKERCSEEGEGKWAHSCHDRQCAVIGESIDRRSTNCRNEEGIFIGKCWLEFQWEGRYWRIEMSSLSKRYYCWIEKSE